MLSPEDMAAQVTISNESVAEVIAEERAALKRARVHHITCYDHPAQPHDVECECWCHDEDETATGSHAAPGMPDGAPDRAREIAETMPTVGQWPARRPTATGSKPSNSEEVDRD